MKKVGDISKTLIPSPSQRRLINAAAEIYACPPKDSTDRAYMARHLVQVTLPHRNPGNVEAWERTNGNVTLTIRPGWDTRKKQRLPYPSGSIPRLVLFWITTEALRTRSRTLYPGNTLSGFMQQIGLDPWTGGGKRSDAKRLRDQMHLLFRAIISIEQIEQHGRNEGLSWVDMQVAPEGQLWWDISHPDHPTLFESKIVLREPFYDAIRTAPVPVDVRALKALKGSPLALDLYAWLSYRTWRVNQSGKKAFIPWRALHQQMGDAYRRPRDFKRYAKKALRKVHTVYRDLKIEDAEGGFTILPSSRPAIPPRSSK